MTNAADGYPGYGLLVGNWDFGYPWGSNVAVRKKTGHPYGL